MDIRTWLAGGKSRIRALFCLKKRREIALAFQACFMDEDGNLTENGKIVLCYLRDLCHAKGEIRDSRGKPLYRRQSGSLDKDEILFTFGEQRLFNVIVQHLSLNELELFNLRSRLEDDDEHLISKLVI